MFENELLDCRARHNTRVRFGLNSSDHFQAHSQGGPRLQFVLLKYVLRVTTALLAAEFEFEFGEGSHDDSDGPSRWSGCVDSFS